MRRRKIVKRGRIRYRPRLPTKRRTCDQGNGMPLKRSFDDGAASRALATLPVVCLAIATVWSAPPKEKPPTAPAEPDKKTEKKPTKKP